GRWRSQLDRHDAGDGHDHRIGVHALRRAGDLRARGEDSSGGRIRNGKPAGARGPRAFRGGVKSQEEAMKSNPLRILLQTTTPERPDDWSIRSFSLLRRHLESGGAGQGWPVAVTARNREASGSGSDPVLAAIDKSDFDELWLFALDSGGGLTAEEAAAIGRFRRRGRGLVTARDHQDVGCSLCSIRGVGTANRFHSRNPEPQPSRRKRDDRETAGITWPNYPSGNNGDFQKIEALDPVHPLLHDPENRRRTLEFFPAHPHEGAVSAPPGDDSARVIAVGRSVSTRRP